MSYEKVLQDANLIIGTKQTLKALDYGNVSKVFIAKDAEGKVIHDVEALASEKSIPILYVDSMKKLGKACGIDVGAATVAQRI